MILYDLIYVRSSSAEIEFIKLGFIYFNFIGHRKNVLN